MKIKPGDLVMIVGASRPQDKAHLGKVVTADEFDGECWLTEPELPSIGDGDDMVVAWYEWELKLIQGGAGDDETLTWAGKPEQVTS